MRPHKVEEILKPYHHDLPPLPAVTLKDNLIHAVQVMVSENRKSIAVVRNGQPIGMIFLEDAFQTLGLEIRPG